MEFGKFISQALKITWQHKVLWLFAALPMGLYLVLGLFQPTLFMASPYQPLTQREAAQMMSQALGFLAVECVVFLLAFVITPISIGGMVKGIQNALLKKKLAFGKLFQESLHYYWRLFLIPFIAIIFGLIIAVVITLVFALFIPISANQDSAPAFSAFFFTMCCLYILVLVGAILIGIVLLLSYIGVVVDDLGVGDALNRSWGFIRRQFGHVFAATIIYGFIGFVIVVIFYAVYFGALFATGSIDFTSYESMMRFSQGWFPKAFLVTFYAAFSIFTVFFYALWTQTYQALKDMPVTKRITRSKSKQS